MADLPLELTETVQPSTAAEVAETLRAAHDRRQAVYPLGGRTALGQGLAGRTPGIGLSTTGLASVVDYPARDMTITVEAGITMAALAELTRPERQRLPIDVPAAGQATLGGAIATNVSGPRRFGQGTIRDYVIGISAVDGRGVAFKGGGRVVKNVAGYDFCKLLCGSLGSLGVITQVTLKVKPLAEHSALVAHDLASWDEAEMLLAALNRSQTTPVAIELLSGPAWNDDPDLGPLARGALARLVVGLEGSTAEVGWMIDQLRREWQALGVSQTTRVEGPATGALWQLLTDFPLAGGASPGGKPAANGQPLVAKLSVPPSRLTALARLVGEVDPQASLEAQAGNGVLRVRFARPAGEMAGDWVRRVQPAAAAAQGSGVLLSTGAAGEWTRQAVWGGTSEASAAMLAVKRQFDPHHILNPGRFIFPV